MDLLCSEDAALVATPDRRQQVVRIVTPGHVVVEAGTDARVVAGRVPVAAPDHLHHLLVTAELVVMDHVRALNWTDWARAQVRYCRVLAGADN